MPTDTAKQHEMERALKSLINVLQDGQKGFADIGEHLKDDTLKRYFLAESLKRASFRAELENELHRQGVHDVKESGTVFWLIVVIAIAIAGVIVAFKPLNTANFQDACPSVVQAFNGPFSIGQAARDATTGQCTEYLNQMIGWLLLLSVCFLGGRAELWVPFDAASSRLRPQPPELLTLATLQSIASATEPCASPAKASGDHQKIRMKLSAF